MPERLDLCLREPELSCFGFRTVTTPLWDARIVGCCNTIATATIHEDLQIGTRGSKKVGFPLSFTHGFGELDMLVPAYAATIHKSQGSEYPAVVIPILTQRITRGISVA